MSEGKGSLSEQLAALEALLFVAAEPVNKTDLQKALGVEEGWLDELLDTLNGDYADQGRGLRVFTQQGYCQLVTAPEAAPYIEKFLGLQSGGKLSAAALETLTIIAYRQPITRQAVEAIRGVDSSGVINTLQGRGLIEEVGRSEAVGHPVLFGTTFEFLHQYGLASLKELPPLKELEDTKDTTTPGSVSL
jgi:segregation and condensation protein B